MNSRITRPHFQQSPANGERVEQPKDTTGNFKSVHPSPNQVMRECHYREKVEGNNMPLHNTAQSHDTTKPRPLFQESFGSILHSNSDGKLRFSRQGCCQTVGIFDIVAFVGILARVSVLEAFTRPKEFIEIIVVAFIDVVGVGFHAL